MPDSTDDIPQGVVFPGLRDETRRGPLLAFLAVTAVSGLALIWPIYPVASDVRPYVLGVPLSFAWTVGWLVVMFVALGVFYRTDGTDAPD